MRQAALIAAVLLLVAGCGVDGPPTAPEPGPGTESRVSVSGTASVGVSGSF